MGAKGQPYYRVVVVDERKKRDGKVLEVIGRYNPRTQPSNFEIDKVRLNYWTGVGAQLTEPVQVLLGTAKPKRHAEKNVKPEIPVPTEAPTAKADEAVEPADEEKSSEAPETTPEASPELAKTLEASDEVSIPASPEVTEQVIENSDQTAASQVAEDHEPTTQEEKVSIAEQVQENSSETEGQEADKTTSSSSS